MCELKLQGNQPMDARPFDSLDGSVLAVLVVVAEQALGCVCWINILTNRPRPKWSWAFFLR